MVPLLKKLFDKWPQAVHPKLPDLKDIFRECSKGDVDGSSREGGRTQPLKHTTQGRKIKKDESIKNGFVRCNVVPVFNYL